MRGPLLILSGPSGVGKSTAIRELLTSSPRPLHLAVSCTTRAPRPGEIDGRDYRFVPVETFRQRIQEDYFLEWAQVHGSQYYGTPREEVDLYRDRGIGVILDVDVQGARQVRAKIGDAYAVFLHVPAEEYERRLRARNTETEEKIQSRLRTAVAERDAMREYHLCIENHRLEETMATLLNLLEDLFSQEKTHAR